MASTSYPAIRPTPGPDAQRPDDHRPALVSRAPLGNPLYRWTAIFGGVALLLMTVLQPWMTYKPEPFTGEGSPLRQICYFALLPLVLLARRPLKRPTSIFVVPLTMVLALGWCWLSLSWSIEPGISLRRLMLTTIVIWIVFLVVEEVGYELMMKLIRILLLMALVANFLAVLLFPTFGIHQAAELSDPGLVGDWRGIMLQKNFAGALCAFTVLTFALDARRIRGWVRVAVIAGSLFFLIMSGSKTSMGIALLGLVCGWIYSRYNPAFRALLVPAVMILGTALFIFIQLHWDAITAPLSDQSAFTGRTQIWPALLAYHSDHPQLGAGYGSFWNIGEGRSPIFAYSKGWVVHMVQGHNGYLDLLVTIGLPGVLLVVLATVVAPITRLLASRTAPRQTGGLLLAMIIFGAGHNLTESSLFDRDSIVQTFLVLAVAMAHHVTAGLWSVGPVASLRANRRRAVA